jgi:hypothetical protein
LPTKRFAADPSVPQHSCRAVAPRGFFYDRRHYAAQKKHLGP